MRFAILFCLCFAPWMTYAASWKAYLPKPKPGVVWQAELGPGIAYSFHTNLDIEQDAFPDIDFTAHYETRAFSMPPHYILRVSRWFDNHAWSIEELHHKIYLTNNPAEVDAFSISHGYNMITLQHAWKRKHDIVYRVGAGVVLAHPENKVRGRRIDSESGGWFDGGYYLTGPAIQVAVGKLFAIGHAKHWMFNLEGKATAARARVKVVGGHAVAPNLAVHAVASLVWNSGALS